MRIFKYLALAGLVSLAACNNDDNLPINGGENGKSTTAMRLVVGEFAGQPQPQAAARAITDDQNDAEGATGESEVKNGYFMTMSNKQQVSLTDVTNVTSFTPIGAQEAKKWASDAFEYNGTTGPVNAALVINKTAAYQDLRADMTLPLTDLSKVAKSGEFTMSTKTTKEIIITPEVSAEDVATNTFSFEVERLASKVQVTQPQAGFAVGGDLADKATFANPRYAVAGGAKKIYLFGDKAGDRTLKSNVEKGAIYEGFESAIHGLTPTQFEIKNGVWEVKGNERDVTKVSADKLATLSTDTEFQEKQSLSLPKATTTDGYQNTSAANNGIYFYENSVNATELNYNDITHVKVYAQMLPADGAQVIKSKNPQGTPVMATKGEIEAGTEDDEVEVSQEFYNKRKAIEPDKCREELSPEGDVTTYYYKMTNAANTFFVGADGKMYLTLSAARAFGNKTSKKYSGGQMLWKTPANRQVVGDNVKYADTRRNNIYSLNVTEISGIGKNYDPVDPTDPNSPKPEDNPDEPTVDEKDPVNETKTHIKVEATILKWNLVHRGVVL